MEVFIYLSKTKLKYGFQCIKNLYFHIHHADLARPFTLQEQSLFKQGGDVQAAARKRFPNGVLIQAPYWNFDLAQEQTQKTLAQKPSYIYEAFFFKNNLMARVDILHLKEDSMWDIIEVKSSMSLKDDHLWDAAIQKYIMNQCSYSIDKCFILHLNKACVYPDLENLFIKKEITAEVNDLQTQAADKVEEFKRVLSQKKLPEVDVGIHCNKPYECRFKSQCWGKIPQPSVLNMPEMGTQAWEFYRQGKVELKDVPDKELLPRQKIYKKVHLCNEPYVDKKSIQKELSLWKKPLYYLDFETISPAIPRFKGVSPFQHIPFQFSAICIFDEKDSSKDIGFFQGQKITEEHYLHTDFSDPRYELSKKLAAFVGEQGSVVAYYKQFESLRLKEMAKLFPDLSESLLSIESRLVDPLPLLRNHVCFKEFGSSWSMKSVAPVLLGEKWNYSHLQVQDGLMAQHTFERMLTLDPLDPKREMLKKSLISYCSQDTYCLAGIVEWLYKQIVGP